MKQCDRREIGGDACHGVKKCRLIGDFHRSRLIERGHRVDRHAAGGGKEIKRLLQVALTIPKVRAHSDGGNAHPSSPRRQMASATLATRAMASTSCTRTISAPPAMDRATAAAV